MYKDAKIINFFVGCRFDCGYCDRSFKRQMKRQLHNCRKCYDYVPHEHLDRLEKSFPKTEGDQFIWLGASGDITFAKRSWMEAAIAKIREYPDRTFAFQTKNPRCLLRHEFPDNVLLGITLETNIADGYREVSKAPLPGMRVDDFEKVEHPRKFVTVEPIMEFDLEILLDWIKGLNPERVYVGYESHDTPGIPQPPLSKTEALIERLAKFTVVKTKFIRKYHDLTEWMEGEA
jgi:hypothetical protein